MGTVSALERGALLVVLLIAGCAPTQRSKGLQPSLTTRAALAESLAPQRIALLVGVDRYTSPDLPALKYAVADAEAMGEMLDDPASGGFDDTVVLADVDRKVVVRALLELERRVRREDSVVLYFSGHGTRVQRDARWVRYLLTHDSRPSDLAGTAIDLEGLQDFVSRLPALRKALIVDACFQGGGKSVQRIVPPADQATLPDSPLTPPTSTLGGGESYLYATTSGRAAREDDTLEHGVYTYFLLEAMGWGFSEANLDGDGVITAYEMHDHARSRTMAFTDGAQIPEASLRIVGDADLVVAGDPNSRTESERAMIYLYGTPSRALADAEVLVDGRNRGTLPGAVATTPGLHQITIQRRNGQLALDGRVVLRKGQGYGMDDLTRLLHGPKRLLSARLGYLSMPGLAEVFGAGGPALELGWLRRANRGVLRGLYAGLSLGVGGSQSRTLPSLGRVSDGRVWTSTGLELGYQHDWRRARLRLGWAASGLVLPPDDLASLDLQRAEAGWWLVGAGPTLGVGVPLRERSALVASWKLQAPWLDLQQTGRGQWVPWQVGGLGLEFAY